MSNIHKFVLLLITIGMIIRLYWRFLTGGSSFDLVHSSSSPQNKQLDIYKARVEHLRSVCQKYGPSLKGYNAHIRMNLLVSEERDMAYCRHGKVGTSTWLLYFLHLTDLHEEVKEKYAATNSLLHKSVPELFRVNEKKFTADLLQKLYKFSFVRHPFERIISAYENKILGWRHVQESTYVTLHDKLMNEYGNISFPVFVEHILAEQRLDPSTNLIHPDHDVHWRPFYCRCAYCDIDYDFIGKIETFEEDVKYILQKLNIDILINDDGTVAKRNERTHSQELSQEARLEKYMEILTPQTKMKLFEHYRVDFEMFDYSYDI